MGDMETQPAVLAANVARFGARVAMRRKQYGIWQEWSWDGYAAHVRRVALGLVSLGFRRGDKLVILGDNDPEWYWAELAAQSLGGVAVGVFVDCLADEVAYYLTHAGAGFVIARDQEQVDKLLAIRDRVPDLRKIVFWDPKGLWACSDPLLMSFEVLEAEGNTLESFAVVLLAGLESIAGVLVAGPLIGVIELYAGYYVDPLVGGGTTEIAPLVVLLIALLTCSQCATGRSGCCRTAGASGSSWVVRWPSIPGCSCSMSRWPG
jgi:AMP-binding enzyme